MLTKQDALTANEFHYGACLRSFGPRGGQTIRQIVWRRNGRTQTWKARPNEYRVPVKYGMYSYDNLTHADAPNFHTASECPLNRSARDAHEYALLQGAMQPCNSN